MGREFMEGRYSRNPERLPSGILLKKIRLAQNPDTYEYRRQNKKRGYDIAVSLVGEIFDKVAPASKNQRMKKATDFFGIVRIPADISHEGEIRIPFVISNSAKVSQDLQAKYPHVACLTVHPEMTDEFIKENILQHAIRRLL